MRITTNITIAALLFSSAHAALPDHALTCAASYERRPDRAAVEEAIRCYHAVDAAQLAAATPTQRFNHYEALLSTLTYAVTHYNGANNGAAQRAWANHGLSVSTTLDGETALTNPQRGAAKFWLASFITFDVALRDGLPIAEEPRFVLRYPSNTMGALEHIRSLFMRAAELNRTYLGCGPYRNLGIIHLSRPEFFFPGSADLAVQALRDTYSCDPWFSLNTIYLARALRRAGRAQEAVPLLQDFITAATTEPQRFGASRVIDTLEDVAKARVLLAP